LLTVLGRMGPSKSADLARALAVSDASALRFLQEAAAEVLQAGQARRRRYAVRRALRGTSGPMPLFAVGDDGQVTQAGELALVQPQGSWLALDNRIWPLPPESTDGWWEGLPYPLLDMRPQGYMGRQLATQVHDAMGVSTDPRQWSDDDVVLVMLHFGADLQGHLILGERALRLWQQQRVLDTPPLAEHELAQAYPELAARALADGATGSSAGGEFPKFTAVRQGPAGSATPHVIVKFSGAGGSAAEQRWADLLLCEHHAAQALASMADQTVARTRILQTAGRTFLEVERFDRVGRWGRKPLLSLATADAGLIGARTSEWPALLRRLLALKLCDEVTVAATDQRWWFGRLIANTDMHTGNLSLQPQSQAGASPRLQLAPSYDMLPMLLAPLQGGELPLRVFNPPSPAPAEQAAWQAAAGAARLFWAAVLSDTRVSLGFRQLAATMGQAVERAAPGA